MSAGEKSVMLRPISGTSSPHESDEPSSSVERKVREVWNQQERAMKSESVGRDITDRHRIEELGRKYEFIANASREFMTLIDRNYVYEAANDAYCRAHGKSRREIVGKTVADLWGEADFENSIRPRLDRCFSGCEVRYEAQFQFLGGEKRWYDVGCYPYFDDSGKVTHAAVVTRDIHERKKSEQAVKRSEQKLKESENRLDSILKTIPDIVYRLDHEGRITFISHAVENYGFATSELVGKKIMDLVHPEDRDKAFYRINERRTGERRTKSFEIRLMTRDHGMVSFEVRSRELEEFTTFLIDAEGIYDSTDPTGKSFKGTQGIARDISERKHLEAQLLHDQKMEAVGKLAGGIAHDFNNLLQVIQGYTDLLLLDKNTGDRGYREILEIGHAASKGAKLVHQLLTFSRRIESKLRPINLNHEVTRVVNLLDRTILKTVQIEIHLADNLWNINGDSSQLEQVLINLSVNARDAMPEGGRLIIETQNTSLDDEYCKRHLWAQPGDYVLLTVSDTGFGMDGEIREHIFEPFYSTKEIGKGSGLGLAMVYGIVKNHGGYIMCYSEPGEGTIFKIYFPTMEKSPVRPHPQAARSGLQGGNETILLVDDEEFIRTLVKQLLGEFGYTVHTVSSGEEALRFFENATAHPDLVILDLIMPGMGGRRCLQELLRRYPRAKILVASGFSANGPARETMELGAKGFVGKPYQLRDILMAIRQVLEGNGT